jgi:TfoX/Sxy family transcriptional regulator of competence genes
MFGGLVFMYKDKMLCGIINDELMCRIDPAIRDELLEQNGVNLSKQ